MKSREATQSRPRGALTQPVYTVIILHTFLCLNCLLAERASTAPNSQSSAHYNYKM